MQGAWVRSLLGELRSCMPQPKKKKKVFQRYLSIQMKEKDLKVPNVLH